mgnify:CR=1 FL=1
MSREAIKLEVSGQSGAPNPPCKNCTDRYGNCHSKCEKYLEFRKALTAFDTKYKKEKYKKVNSEFYEKAY